MCVLMKRSLLVELAIKFTDDFARLLSEDFSKAESAGLCPRSHSKESAGGVVILYSPAGMNKYQEISNNAA